VARRYFDEGTITAPGTSLLRIIEDSRLEAWIRLPAATAAGLDEGQSLPIEVAGRHHSAILIGVLPELDPITRTRTAIFELERATEGVVPSQLARIEIRESTEVRGSWLPTTALSRGSRGLWSVLVVEQEGDSGRTVAARRDVELLHTDGERVLVRGTLQAGDRVIQSGTHRIVAGQSIEAEG
jgi:hypothetical protein